ncbi:hypothetical protein Pla52n_18040 [Stieleria varia]|uniref:Uncharacterized protein n=1 Tax=Stieleria varia TaxID=2528005 RepID=A0A5C6B6E4_9BACT|nr:hypothetical protein Pla52n_18040 [Stieleria varia]
MVSPRLLSMLFGAKVIVMRLHRRLRSLVGLCLKTDGCESH